MSDSENYLLLEVRDVRESERVAETHPFRCELWGKAPGEDWAKIADVSNDGCGGCHTFVPATHQAYARFVGAVRYLKGSTLDMTQYLDWALFRLYDYCARAINRTLHPNAPLKDELEVAEQIVTALMDYQSFELEKYWVLPCRRIEYKRFGRGQDLEQDRAAIAREYTGETLINDLKPPALRLPPQAD